MHRMTAAYAVTVAVIPAFTPFAAYGAASATRFIQPQILPRLGTVDPRFQSYNVEMAEVIDGDFWKA